MITDSVYSGKHNLPQELTSRSQWLTWFLTKDGTKVPNGKSNDSTTWTTFEAIQGHERIAYVIDTDDPFTGIDLDNCIDESGQYREWALPILEKFKGVSYCEVSPSGTGVKLLTTGTKLPNSKCSHVFVESVDGDKPQQVECYDNRRFWTVTGRCLGDGWQHIGFGQSAIDWLCETYLIRSAPQQATASPQTHYHSDVESQASKYLAAIPGAVEGNRGHDQLFKAANALVKGFDLPTSVAYRMLESEYNGRCSPPWTERELRHKVDDADKSPDLKERGWLVKSRSDNTKKEKPSKPAREKLLYSLDCMSGQTDIANSRRFVDKFAGQLLFIPPWGKWLSWDGKRWHDDNGTGAAQRAKKYADSLWFDLGKMAPQLDKEDLAKMASFIRATSQSAKLSAFMRLAESDERVVCPVELLNSDPLLLNVKNGTVDLRTGTLRPHNPEDRLTQLASIVFDANATCPKWLETLNLVFDGDQQLIDYVQTILGYSISGDVGEAVLPICFGSGNNGKSTIWNTVVELLGDYAMLANESLLLGDGEGHPTDKAMLYQLRFVPISEPERGSKLRESRVKELTGDSTITARRMREDFWSFKRSHTFWLSTNHLPRVSGTDGGIWRRIKLIPFTVDISQRVQQVIPDFSSWLVKNEGAGILNWLLAGWQRYQADRRFNEPEAVRMATSNYRSDSDALGEWIAENCLVEAGAVATANELFERYQATGGKWSKTAFGTAMAERFEKEKPTSGEYRFRVIYHGIRLLSESEKTQQKQGLLPVVTSYPVNSHARIEISESTGQLGTTSNKTQEGGDYDLTF